LLPFIYIALVFLGALPIFLMMTMIMTHSCVSKFCSQLDLGPDC